MNAPAKIRPDSKVTVPAHVKTIMEMIVQAAERGGRCPTNGHLAVCVERSVGTVVDAIALLETMNAIRVERGRNWRVVTIVASGAQTARMVPRGSNSATIEKARRSTSDRRDARIAELCDLVAEEVPIAQAARRLGISQATATSMMAQVRAELGWQAR